MSAGEGLRLTTRWRFNLIHAVTSVKQTWLSIDTPIEFTPKVGVSYITRAKDQARTIRQSGNGIVIHLFHILPSSRQSFRRLWWLS